MGSENESRRRRSTLGDEEAVRTKRPKVGKNPLVIKCSLSPEREAEEEASGFTLAGGQQEQLSQSKETWAKKHTVLHSLLTVHMAVSCSSKPWTGYTHSEGHLGPSNPPSSTWRNPHRNWEDMQTPAQGRAMLHPFT